MHDSPKEPDYHFPAKFRIKKREEFARVFEHGKVAADSVLVIHAVRAPEQPTRLGLSISKRVGCAPVRNYWKRLIREAFRFNRKQLPENLLIVVRPRRGASPSFDGIQRSLTTLLNRLDRKL